MINGAFLRVSLVLFSFPKGETAVIQTQQTVVAAVGEDALLSCQLTQPKDVLQVTWQKVFPRGEVNVATFSEPFGPKVFNNFTDKVELKDAGLQSCSIVIRKVTEQDEGCYLCVFNSYPDGALTGTTCLQLYELHEPTLHVRESNSAEESLVSCSATGRPALTVTLTVSQPHIYLSQYNTVSVSNNNRTVTVTTTAVLSGFRDNSTQVGCAVRVLSVHKEVFVMIPGLKQTPADGFDEEYGSDHRDSIRIWIVLVPLGCVAAVIIVMCLLQRNNSLSHRDHEMREMPQTPPRDTDMSFLLQSRRVWICNLNPTTAHVILLLTLHLLLNLLKLIILMFNFISSSLMPYLYQWQYYNYHEHHCCSCYCLLLLLL
ncbi:OX-2 membrane glycoprotein-like isoform X2 [Trachinotus anak]|uniref:OX-2 membrane glycoprotein-like isoform X2 n=1 Tax=Trachinotus anak TaxID=443729 RepID=UPI0039F20471